MVSADVPRCPECDVPEYISQEHTWLNDGSIVQTRLRETRLAFMECENWDPIWSSISELIGVPIEHLVVDAGRRSSRAYMRQIITDEAREMLREGQLSMDAVFGGVFQVAKILGTADPSFVDVRFEQSGDDYAVVRFRNPFSVPLMVGLLAGTVEAYTGYAVGFEYQRVTPDTIEAKVFESERPEELKGRMQFKPYHAVAGGIPLQRCPGCGAPSALSGYEWDIDAGIIKSSTTGRRMSLAVGPVMIDAVFRELQDELGEDLPRAAVESQRRFVISGPYAAGQATAENEMRQELALRGLGELTHLKMGRRGARMTVEHSTVHLWVAGLAQGLYELAFGEESKVEWELSEDGRLEVDVTPSSAAKG
jgi:hypothetical protein